MTSNERNFKEKVYIGTMETITGNPSTLTGMKTTQSYPNTESDMETKKEMNTFHHSQKKYYFCRNEELEIVSYKEDNLFNKSSELIKKYRHQNKFIFLRHDSKD